MLRSFLLISLAAAPVSAAGKEKFPEGYWERGYATGQAYSVQYNIRIKVPSLDSAQAEVQRLMNESGATLSGNSWTNYANQRQERSINFSIDAQKAEQTAKKLFGFGDLQSYNVYRQLEKGALQEIEKKIAELTGELDSNAAALENMPIASYLLSAQLRRLKQSRDSIKTGLQKALLSITLSPRESEN